MANCMVYFLFGFTVLARDFGDTVGTVQTAQCPEGVKPGQSVKMPDCSLCTCGSKGYFCYSCSEEAEPPAGCLRVYYAIDVPYPMCCVGTLACPQYQAVTSVF